MRERAWVLLLLVGGACAPAGPAARPEAPSRAPTARSTSGMVVSGSQYATEAGVRMLERGGNAVDAAVAAAFALAVAEPTQSGLGGRTQILIRRADGAVHGIDGTTEVPAGYDAESAPRGEHGHAAVGIPGTVAALTRALAEHGTLPLEVVVAPALAWARDGIVLSAGEAARLAGVSDELDPASEAARIFLGPDGAPLPAGASLRQPDLADVLEAIASGGPDAFYTGAIARRIAEDMAANGGYVTARDLAGYRAMDSFVGVGAFRDAEVVGSYLPASGVTVIEILQVLDRLDLTGLDERAWAAAVVESLLAGFEDRELAEAMAPAEAVAWLTSDSLADRRGAGVRDALRDLALARADPAGLRRAMPDGPAPRAVRPAAAAASVVRGPEPPFTTHVSAADTFGNAVALTQSLGPTLGARVVTPGLGFLYASTLGGYLTGGGPGYRPWSSQAPLIVVGGGKPMLVLGGAGARRIVSALVTVLDRVLRSGEEVRVAMDAPRLHPTGGEVLVEEGWAEVEGLEALGFEVVPTERTFFARLNAIRIAGDGTFLGVGEPRWPESAAGGPGIP
ncbi:MAG TPA: gamma-glutamyltransferase [Longimicrobiales bacterium]|nr:gamma-glutamyltransferase [Longimicrobiales bacterium]